MIPELKHHEGSWIVIERATGEAIWEIFDRRTAEAINQAKFCLMTIGDYLGYYNWAVKLNEGTDNVG